MNFNMLRLLGPIPLHTRIDYDRRNNFLAVETLPFVFLTLQKVFDCRSVLDRQSDGRLAPRTFCLHGLRSPELSFSALSVFERPVCIGVESRSSVFSEPSTPAGS